MQAVSLNSCCRENASQTLEKSLLVSGGRYGKRVGQRLAPVAATAHLLPVQPGKHSAAPVT